MEKYEIYRNINANGKWYESLVCVTFTEKAAHEIVQAFRNAMGNQLYFFRKINK